MADSSLVVLLAIANAVLLANLMVLGLVVKLYTEFAKDRFQSGRMTTNDRSEGER